MPFSFEDKAVIKAVIKNDYLERGWNAYAIWKKHPSKGWDRVLVWRLLEIFKQTSSMEREKGSRPLQPQMKTEGKQVDQSRCCSARQ